MQRSSLVGVRVFLLAVLLASAALGVREAPRAEAQAVPPVVIAPCVTTPVGATACALVAAALVAAYVFAGNPTTQADLTRFGAAVEDWWRNLGTDERALVTGKVNESGEQFLYDFDTYQSLGAALAAQTEAGFLLDGPTAMGALTGAYVIERVESEPNPNASQLMYEAWARGIQHTPYYPTGVGCQSACHRGYLWVQAPAGAAGAVRLTGWWHDDPTTQAASGGVKNFQGGATEPGAWETTAYFSTSNTGDQIAAHGGIDFRLEFLSATAQYGGSAMDAGWRIGPLVWEGGLTGDQVLQPTMWDVALVAGAAALPALEDGESRTIKIPALPDGYIGATEPNPDVLLEDGTTGPAVGDLVGAPPTGGSLLDLVYQAWWAAQFGGIVTAVGALGTLLTPATTNIASIASAVAAWPTTLTNTLTTLAVPTTTWDPLATRVDAVEVAFPPCVVSGVVGVAGSMFAEGDTSLSIPFGAYGEIDLTDSFGLFGYVKNFSRFIIATTMALYGYSVYRRFFPGT